MLTKAKKYLKTRNSDMQHLTSFGLMLATAQSRYNQLRLDGGGWGTKEVEILLDFAVLKYLKKFNQLPRNIGDAFNPDATVDTKKELALQWANSNG